MSPKSAVQQVWEFVQNSGPWVWPILAAFGAGLLMSIESTISLRRSKHVPADFEKDVLHTVDIRGIDAGLAFCQEHPSSLATVLSAALLRHSGSRMEQESAVVQKSGAVLYELTRNLRLVALMSLMLALLGLTGTCTALIARLQHASLSAATPAQIAGTVAGALSTSAIALIGALPLVYAYFRLRSRAQDLVHEIETRSIDAVISLDRKARQSIRLIEDIEEAVETKEAMQSVKAIPPDLAAEFEDAGRDGSAIKSGITTPAHLPTVGRESGIGKKAKSGIGKQAQ